MISLELQIDGDEYRDELHLRLEKLSGDSTAMRFLQDVILPVMICIGYSESTVYDAMFSLSSQMQECEDEF